MKNNIRQLRKARGLTIAQLAEAIETSAPNLQRLESGGRQLNNKWLTRLADYFGCKPADILTSDDFMTMQEDVKKAVTTVLRGLEASGFIKGRTLPLDQVADLVRGAWIRRNRNPEITEHEVNLFVASELGLLSGKQRGTEDEVMQALEGNTDTPVLPPSKLN